MLLVYVCMRSYSADTTHLLSRTGTSEVHFKNTHHHALLSAEHLQLEQRVRPQYMCIHTAVTDLLAQSKHNFNTHILRIYLVTPTASRLKTSVDRPWLSQTVFNAVRLSSKCLSESIG